MRAWLGLGVALVAGHASAAPAPAVVLELVDAEPIGVRVAAINLAYTGVTCAFATVLFEGVLEKGKPISVASDAYRLCISQTSAPNTKAGFGAPLLVVRGALPVHLMLRSRPPPGPTALATPLTVVVEGKERIGVRISAGTTAPCDASVNTPLFSGVLEPDVPRAFVTEAACVCFEQTFAPFTTTGFTGASIRCRPCLGGKYCKISLTAPFTLALASRPP